MKLLFLRKWFCFFILFLHHYNMQKNHTIFTGIIFLMMMVPLVSPIFAQSNDFENGLYKEMEQSKAKVEIATQPGAIGSGTPVFAADGVLTASLVSGGIFGGIAATFFIRGRKGKYAAMGRG